MREIYKFQGEELRDYIQEPNNIQYIKIPCVLKALDTLKTVKPQDCPILTIVGLDKAVNSEVSHYIINELQQYENTLLVELDDTPIKSKELQEIIEMKLVEIQHIFIDNITYTQDLVNNISKIYDIARQKRVNIVFLTSNKVSLSLAVKNNKHCPIEIIDTDKIYYRIHQELFHSNLFDYILHPSLDQNNIILADRHLSNFIYTMVKDNIQQDIYHHNRAKLVATISRNRLCTLISNLLHAMVYMKAHGKTIKNLDDLLNTKLLSQNTSIGELDAIIEFLAAIDLILKIGIGIEGSSLNRYYITNPSIVNYIENIYTGKSGVSGSIYSVTVENLLVTHLYNMSKDLRYSMYIEGGINNLVFVLERRTGTIWAPVFVRLLITIGEKLSINKESQTELTLSNLVITDKPTLILDNGNLQKINILEFMQNTEEWLKPLANYEGSTMKK